MFGAHVAGDVAVGHDGAVMLEIEAFGAGTCTTSCRSGRVCDRHVASHAGHFVDARRARPGHVDRPRAHAAPRRRPVSRPRCDRPLQDPDDLDPGAARAPCCRGRASRFCALSAGSVTYPAFGQNTPRPSGARWAGRTPGHRGAWPARNCPANRSAASPAPDRRSTPRTGNPRSAEYCHVLSRKPLASRLHRHAADLAEPGQRRVLGQGQVVGPVAPVVIAFPGEGGAVERRIMHPDDGAGPGRRAVPGLAVAVERQRHSILPSPSRRRWRRRSRRRRRRRSKKEGKPALRRELDPDRHVVRRLLAARAPRSRCRNPSSGRPPAGVIRTWSIRMPSFRSQAPAW
jgi:hypothetical protein